MGTVDGHWGWVLRVGLSTLENNLEDTSTLWEHFRRLEHTWEQWDDFIDGT